MRSPTNIEKTEVRMWQLITDLERKGICTSALCGKSQEVAMEMESDKLNNAMVIGTACSKTICGSDWFFNFVHSLSPEEEQRVHCHESHMPLKFRDMASMLDLQKTFAL